jgi:hypothetical protein
MNQPSNETLLAGIADALEDTVVPELARGGQARRQVQAAIAVLRRIAYALPLSAEAIDVDNADIEFTLRQCADQFDPNIAEALDNALDVLPPEPDRRNAALQTLLAEIQADLPDAEDRRLDIITRLRLLFVRLIARETELIPPDRPRTPRAPAA